MDTRRAHTWKTVKGKKDVKARLVVKGRQGSGPEDWLGETFGTRKHSVPTSAGHSPGCPEN